MLSFTPYDLTAVAITAPYFAVKEDRLCDWTAAGCYLWSSSYTYAYTIVADCLIMQLTLSFGQLYSYPMGQGDTEAALAALEQHCREVGQPLRFASLSPELTDRLSRRYGEATRVKPLTGYSDYLYRYEDLSTFAGRRYSGQRNHINQFIKKHPAWQYLPLTAEQIPSVLAFADEYIRLKQSRGEMAESELEDMNGVRGVLAAWTHLPVQGGVITVDDTVVGFAVGEQVGDTLYVHIEKADIRYAGVYQLLVREFAAHSAAEGLRYINREDDAGDPGLRQSKLAYRPCAMAEKFSITIERNKPHEKHTS